MLLAVASQTPIISYSYYSSNNEDTIVMMQDSTNNNDCFGSVDLQMNIVRKGMPASLPVWFDSEVRGRLGVTLTFHPNELQQPLKSNVNDVDKLTATGSMSPSTSTSQTSRKRLKAMDGSELLFLRTNSDKDEVGNGKVFVELDGEDHRNDKKLTHKLIPAASRKYESDLVVVLDLDECLVHTENVSADGTVDLPLFREHVLSPFESQAEWTDIQDSEYKSATRIFLRPYVIEFLQSVSSRFETHLFTAGTRGYADLILQKFLDTDQRIFAYIHAREECTFNEDGTGYYKDLRVVFNQRETRRRQQQQQQQQQETWCDDQDRASSEFDEFVKRVVHVDNMSSNFLCNPSNGIVVCDFYNDHNDMTLLNVLNLLHTLDHSSDVRSVLEYCFQLQTKLWVEARSYWPDNTYLNPFYPVSSVWNDIDISTVTNFSDTSELEGQRNGSGSASKNILTKVFTSRPGSAMKAARKRTKRKINWEDVHPKQTMKSDPKGALCSLTRWKTGRNLLGIKANVVIEEDENDDEEREE